MRISSLISIMPQTKTFSLYMIYELWKTFLKLRKKKKVILSRCQRNHTNYTHTQFEDRVIWVICSYNLGVTIIKLYQGVSMSNRKLSLNSRRAKTQ